MDNSIRFYDELLIEQNKLQSKLKSNGEIESKEDRETYKNLALIDGLIKNVLKYNKYIKQPKKK